MRNDKRVTGNDAIIVKSIQEFLCTNKPKLDELLCRYKTFTPKDFIITAKNEEFINTNIDVLILTATPIETFTLLDEMSKHKKPIQELISERGRSYHIGKLGEYNVVHIQSTMGTDAYATALMAINKWNPKLIISLGIAYGNIIDKHKLGDIIFPTLILPPIDGKISNGELYFNINTWAPNTEDYIRNLMNDIASFYSQQNKFSINIGSIISCPFVISDPKFKKMLFNSVKHFRAIGGEMESYDIYKAVYEAEKTLGKKYCFMLKGISDWAESKNCSSDDEQDSIQLFAVNNALSVLLELMSNDEYFKPIGIFSHKNRMAIDDIKWQLQQYSNLVNQVKDTKQNLQQILMLHDTNDCREFLDNLKVYGFCDNNHNLTDKGVLLLYSL